MPVTLVNSASAGIILQRSALAEPADEADTDPGEKNRTWRRDRRKRHVAKVSDASTGGIVVSRNLVVRDKRIAYHRAAEVDYDCAIIQRGLNRGARTNISPLEKSHGVSARQSRLAAMKSRKFPKSSAGFELRRFEECGYGSTLSLFHWDHVARLKRAPPDTGQTISSEPPFQPSGSIISTEPRCKLDSGVGGGVPRIW